MNGSFNFLSILPTKFQITYSNSKFSSLELWTGLCAHLFKRNVWCQHGMKTKGEKMQASFFIQCSSGICHESGKNQPVGKTGQSWGTCKFCSLRLHLCCFSFLCFGELSCNDNQTEIDHKKWPNLILNTNLTEGDRVKLLMS